MDVTKLKSLMPKNFTIIRILGNGMYGNILMVKNTSNNDVFVIKTIFEKLSSKGKTLTGAKAFDSPQSEINTLRMVTREPNPHVLRLYAGVFQIKDIIFIPLQGCDGDLFTLINESKNLLPYAVAKKYARDIAVGLKHLHCRLKMTHNDISPENIFVKDNTLKIADFGVSKPMNSKWDKNHIISNKRVYLSPEILSKKMDTCTGKNDIYAFGVCVFIILFKILPFEQPFDLLYQEIQAGHLQNVLKSWGFLEPNKTSPSTISFLETLWTEDPELRPDIEEVCKMDWWKK